MAFFTKARVAELVIQVLAALIVVYIVSRFSSAPASSAERADCGCV